MTKPNLVNRFHRFLLFVTLGIAALGIYKVPAEQGLIMHWTAQGQADWVWPPIVGYSILPVFAAILLLVAAAGSALAPKSRLEMVRHILDPALTAILALGVCLQFGLLLIGIGSDFDIIRMVAFALAALLVLLGILLREAERHTYAGLRLPWAMTDDRVWRRTHRLAGWSYVIAGTVLAALAWLQPYPGTLIVAMPLVLALPVLLARMTVIGTRTA